MTTIKGVSKTTSDPTQCIHNEKPTTSNKSTEPTLQEQTLAKKKLYQTIKNTLQRTTYQVLSLKTIGILFIIGGFLVVSRTIPGTQKLGILLALVGVIFIFFISIKKPLMNDKDIFSALALSIWIIASYFITFQGDSEIFFILIFAGFLIITELSQEYISKIFQKKLNIMLFFFFMIFLLIIVEKIAIILRS